MYIQLFSYIDGSYYALHIIRELLSQEGSPGIGQNYDPSNTLDLLRVLTVPDEDVLTEAKSTHTHLLVIPENSHNSDLPESDDEDTDDDDDESVNGDNDYYTQANTPVDSITNEKGHNSDPSTTLSKKRKADLDLLAQLSNTSALKRKKQLDTDNNNLTSTTTTTNTALKRRLPLSKRVYILSYHKRIFGKCWLLLLSSPPEHPLSLPHHRTILKHLPEHILPHFNKPLLLSEYLTICYKYGGIISILSLESIFILITKYNLDYPNFFLSLYHLCIPETFSAKYRSKFLNLLSISLKSTNIEKHTIAAFIKRLSILTLCIPIYSTLYCIALITSLLREHPECLVLLHRSSTEKGHNSDPSTTNTTTQEYNNDNNITDLQYTNSLSSNTSLYELDLLQLHYSSLISDICITLQNNIHSTLKPGTVIYPTTSTNTSTTNSTTSTTNNNSNIDRIIVQNQPILMSEYIHQTYDSILEVELKKSNKKIVPLASIKPTTLFASNNNNNKSSSSSSSSGITSGVSTSINKVSGASAAGGSKHSISNTSSKGGGGESGRGIVGQLFGG